MSNDTTTQQKTPNLSLTQKKAVEEPKSFPQQWEDMKKTVNNLSAIVINNNNAIAELDRLLSEQTTHLNKSVAMLTAQQNQITALSDTLMAVLELNYEKKEITAEAIQEKLVKFSVEAATQTIKASLDAKEIESTDVVAAKSIIVYKTNDVSYAYSNAKDLSGVENKKVGDKFIVRYLDENQKTMEIEAEIIEIYNSVN